ncbi:hypothetical protein IV203_004938 [Nitzschia inconspicua]|uniref:CRAL-TRIO domain-containing protein n=1 Tax=Nitzschia inconspicua TaxID=303405 RepID=A0A9K3KM20_9STRA|nr:hypothetical protein IV203_004938 [Nitzschia inconspicua]
MSEIRRSKTKPTHWSIPLTAPAFTPLQEQQERNELSHEDREYLRNELYGTEVPLNVSEDEEEELIRQFDECVKKLCNGSIEQTPRSEYCDTRAYLEALEVCPDIVNQETYPIMFLRATNYDVEAAASRLMAHWKVRKDIFGERAFLPITLNGAMKEDLDEVKRGFMTVLPEDEHGRPVVLLDRVGSTCSSTYQRASYLRTLWYMFHCVAVQPKYQKTGYVFLLNLIDWEPHKCNDRIGAKMCFVIIRECVPMKLKAYHATYGSKQTPVKIVEPHIRQMQGRDIRLHLVHHYGTHEDNLKSLEKFGLHKKDLPECVGGDFGLEEHMRWLEEQHEVEKLWPGRHSDTR